MDYGHHDPIHSHRVYRFQAVERAPQRLCDDDGKPGDDDGNPYMTVPALVVKVHYRPLPDVPIS